MLTTLRAVVRTAVSISLLLGVGDARPHRHDRCGAGSSTRRTDVVNYVLTHGLGMDQNWIGQQPADRPLSF